MVKKTTADDSLRDVATKVRASGDQYEIEDGGEVIAVVVPLDAWKESEKRRAARARLRATLEESWERNKDADPEEVERDVVEAVRAVRAEANS